MKQLRLTFSESQLEALRAIYYSDLTDTNVHRDASELASNEDALREAVARKFEEDGYQTQAEQMRNGEMDISQYSDQLNVEGTASDSEIVATVLEKNVPELELDY